MGQSLGALAWIAAVAASLAGGGAACTESAGRAADRGGGEPIRDRDDDGARKAFLAAYPVFVHPRCMNCHPAGDAPLQGDDGREHSQNVLRGPHGKGRFALQCAHCHQSENLPGEHMPPGNPNWHMPPPGMPMVFQGLSPGELAAQLKDPAKNGGRSLDDIVRHLAEDSLVLWGWNPGDGRTLPPLGHAEFMGHIRTWVEKGAAAP